jgi:amidase
MADTFLDATTQAELVRTGRATPLELVDDAITRIEKLNGELNAVIHERFDEARAEAKGPLPDGPFKGVPILFKDLMCAVEGDPYHMGNALLKNAGYRAPHTDDLAQRYFDAGFVYVGRTNTPEFGLVPTTEPEAYGPSRNPWNIGYTTGGSSGGSAAAVASGMVPVAHANDGGGSIRIPASCCGLVGLKPSRGRTSMGPNVSPILSLLTNELCVSRTVRDTAGVLDAVHGASRRETVSAPPPERPFVREVGADPGKLHIALITINPLDTGEIHPDCVAAAIETAQLLESLGHRVEATYPEELANPEIIGHFTTLWSAELAADIAAAARAMGREITENDVEALTWGLAQAGAATTAEQYIQAKGACHALGYAVAEWMEDDFDLILTPTLGEPPVPLGTFVTPEDPMLGFARAATFVPFTPLTNITGQPAISLPLNWNADNLPIGSHLIGQYGREDLLLRVASQIEVAKPWADRIPPVHV